jgi:hypothetical protein
MSSNSDWWSRQLGEKQPQQQPPHYYQEPNAPQNQPQVPIYPAPQFQQPPVYPPQMYQQPQAPMAPAQAPMSSKSGSICPECRGGYYMPVGKTPPSQSGPGQEIYQCYECGYPIRQSGSGVGFRTPGETTGPAQPARQVPTGGWNPTTFIGHI